MTRPIEYGSAPVLGKDLSWKLIEKEPCRINQFTPLAKVEGDKILAFSKSMPYALLRVESLKLPKEAIMPVVHRLDFQRLWEIFEQRGVGEKEEVLVFYVPFFESGIKKFLSRGLPRLHFYLYSKGHLEEIYDPEFQKSLDTEAWSRWIEPIAKWAPKGYGM